MIRINTLRWVIDVMDKLHETRNPEKGLSIDTEKNKEKVKTADAA
jgi:hypothetical protein